MNITVQSSERCLHPGKPSPKQKLSSLGCLCNFSCLAGSKAVFSLFSFVLVAWSPLIHLAAHAMSKATDLSTLMTKRLETDCAWRIGPWDNKSDKLED